MNFFIINVILLVFFIGLIYAQDGGEPPSCSPGEIRTVECNTCRCINRRLACTKKLCVGRSQRDADCQEGEVRTDKCQSCMCLNGRWVCSNRRDCRQRRGVPGAVDLKNTPCAPNDYFSIDCNTCYCNIDKTGYLCTENLCSFTVPPIPGPRPAPEGPSPAAAPPAPGQPPSSTPSLLTIALLSHRTNASENVY